MAAPGAPPDSIVATREAVTVLMAACRDAERIPGAWGTRREASSAPGDLAAQDSDGRDIAIGQAIEVAAT